MKNKQKTTKNDNKKKMNQEQIIKYYDELAKEQKENLLNYIMNSINIYVQLESKVIFQGMIWKLKN